MTHHELSKIDDTPHKYERLKYMEVIQCLSS